MKTTKQKFMVIPVILILLSTVQPVIGEERKNLSDDHPSDSPSDQSFRQVPPWIKRELAGLHKMESTPNPPRYVMGRDVLRLNSDPSREYARQGSWAPLVAKPGEESFHLFTF